MDLFGGNGVEELETDEVEAGLLFDDPSFVQGLLGAEDGEVDPREAGMEYRTPHDVGDLHGAAVFELGAIRRERR
jgi:hypothetical protein